jgi:MtrB/PioB family decaheme-associated outer membrane protein
MKAWIVGRGSWLVAGAALLLARGATGAEGSAFNRGGTDPTLERDARGMSQLVPEPSRTPGGRLYGPPQELPRALPFSSDWNYRLSTELGAAHGPGGAPAIRDYGDYGSGFVLNSFSFSLDRGATAHYLDITAGAVGREDQHYSASFGRHGSSRLSLTFSQVPKWFTDQARTVFLGAGGGSLTLPPGLVPGGNTAAQLAAALEPAPFFELGYTRKNAGIEFEATPGADWRIHAGYRQERKNGTRPFGGASGYPGAPAVETVEAVDYKTHNVSAGLQWASDTWQANLAYGGSFFRNAVDTLTWEHPLDVGNPAVLQRGRMDLYPDNNSHHLKLDFGAALPMRGRLSGGLSWSRMTQDDALIAPTVNSGVLGATNLANWNTTAALSQARAGARIDTRLLHLGGAFSPARDLTLQARLRRHEEDNKTRYAAFNPLTGESGYLGLDGANNSNIVPGLFRVPVRSIPYEQRKDNYGLEADYRLMRRTSMTLGYERESNRDPFREAGRTDEDRVRLALSNRDFDRATVRLSLEHARRSGDDYRFDPNRAFYSGAALLNTPPTLALLRKYDVADRDQWIANGRINFLVARDMDLAVSGKYADNDYGATYGRLSDRVAALNLEWNWQPRPAATAYAHYGFERRKNRMAQINDDPAGWATGDPNAGGAVYPLANRWEEESRDDAHTVGLGFRYAFPRATLESGYALLYSPYRTNYSFASAGALAGGAAAAAGAADGMPDMVFRQQSLETSLKLVIDRSTALRLFHRYERTRIEDWHYDGLPLVFAGGAGVFLGAGPRSYSGNLLGVFFQYAPGKRDQSDR